MASCLWKSINKLYNRLVFMSQDRSDEPEHRQELTETDIMQMLHKKKMKVIEECFGQREKGLTIEEFLKVMLEHLDFDRNNSQQHMRITLALIELFKEIDVNGDGTMQWEEFSNHIIELGLLRNDRSFKNMIKSYFPSETIIDREKHENLIESIHYFEKLKYLFSVEKDSSRFKVYGVNNANLLYEVNAHKGSILAVEHLIDQNLIATSSNDLTINFWDASSFNLKQILSVPEIQLCVRYANWKSTNTQLLYTGGSDSIIHIYDAATLKERGTINGWNPFYRNDSQQFGHNSPIGDILPIDAQQTLVTAGYEGNICLWDCITHLPKKQLKGHTKGVYSLEWCDWSQMNQCLISAGLDHQAFIWNTYVKEKIFLLRGHNHPLVGVKCLPDTPQIVTADIAGMVKVWDVRNFLCMQTFNVPADQVNAFCLTYSTTAGQAMKKRIACASKKLYFYEYDEPKDQFLTDEKICLNIIFNETLLVFITLHADSLKIWSAKDGRLESVYRGLSSAELTVAVLDSRERKLFVGDSDGDIFTVNIKNGARMKSFQKHDSLITGLAHWTAESNELDDDRSKDTRRLISISKGPQVFIHDEDSPQDAQSSCRYTMKQHKQGCNAVVIKEATEMLLTASDDGNIIMTNLVSYRQEILPRNSQNEIKKLVSLGDHNCMVACDSWGKIIFYMIGQNSRFRNKVLFSMQYQTLSLTKKLQVFPVTAIEFDRYNKLLLLGDEFGNVEGWDISDLLKLVDDCRLEEKKKKRRRQNEKEEMSNTSTGFITSFVEKAFVSDIVITDFTPKLVKSVFTIKKAHSDGITHIEVLGKYQSFATSSFDCCCHVWSLKNFKRIGSLIIGGDRNWGLQFNLEERKKNAVKQAKDLLGTLDKGEVSSDSDEDEVKKAERVKRELSTRKDQCLSNVKNLIQRQRKMMQSINDKPERFVDPIEQAERLEFGVLTGDDFAEEEGRTSYLEEDIATMKRQNFAASHLKNQSHARKIGKTSRQG